jgi:hypothetical protein
MTSILTRDQVAEAFESVCCDRPVGGCEGVLGVEGYCRLAVGLDRLFPAERGVSVAAAKQGASELIPPDDLSNLRDETARIVEPYAWEVFDQCVELGHDISQRNGEKITLSLAKADQIQALYVGLGRGSSPAESVSEGLRPFASESERKSESRCDDCAGVNPVWFAPNKLWNLVVGGPEEKGDPGGFLCPNCFIRRAEAAGIASAAWELRPAVDSIAPACGAAEASPCQSEDVTSYGRCRGCFVHEGELHLPDCPVMEANLAPLNPDRVMK